MATTTQKNIQVLPGSREYVETFEATEQYDTLNLFFENEVNIDNIHVQRTLSDAGGEIYYSLYIAYPSSGSSGQETPLAFVTSSSSNKDLTLNNYDSNRNQWFRLPAKSTLRIVVDDTSGTPAGGSLLVSLIGRG